MKTLVDPSGIPTSDGRRVLRLLATRIEQVLDGHLDNTGVSCRLDLSNVKYPSDGHDCCYVCNVVAAMLRAAIEELREDLEESLPRNLNAAKGR